MTVISCCIWDACHVANSFLNAMLAKINCFITLLKNCVFGDTWFSPDVDDMYDVGLYTLYRYVACTYRGHFLGPRPDGPMYSKHMQFPFCRLMAS